MLLMPRSKEEQVLLIVMTVMVFLCMPLIGLWLVLSRLSIDDLGSLLLSGALYGFLQFVAILLWHDGLALYGPLPRKV